MAHNIACRLVKQLILKHYFYLNFITYSNMNKCWASSRFMEQKDMLVYSHALALIEHAHLYLSQCSELNGKNIYLAENFGKTLEIT